MRSSIFNLYEEKSLKDKIELGEFKIVNAKQGRTSVDLEIDVEGEEKVKINISDTNLAVIKSTGNNGMYSEPMTRSREYLEIEKKYLCEELDSEVSLDTIKNKLRTLLNLESYKDFLGGILITSENTSIVFGDLIDLSDRNNLELFEELMVEILGFDTKHFKTYNLSIEQINDGSYKTIETSNELIVDIELMNLLTINLKERNYSSNILGVLEKGTYLEMVFTYNILKLLQQRGEINNG